MRKTIYAKMTALPVGLCALAFAVTIVRSFIRIQEICRQ